MEEVTEVIEPKKTKKKLIYIGIVILFVILIFIKELFIGSITTFNQPKIIKFDEGETIKSLAENLYREDIISSKSLFLTSIIFLNGEKKVDAGFYQFKKNEGAFFVARRFIDGNFGINSVKITIPEGFTVTDIADRLSDIIPDFDRNIFLNLAANKEGYLFPDTYFFMPNVKPSEIAKKLEETFWQKMEQNFNIKEKSDEFNDKLILSSIIEEEVRSLEDKKIVAGIFQNRLKIGMPLQADSTLAYVTGRDSLSLTKDDLKSKSLYNTYTNKGLPPTPISNPGLESIEAVLHPTETKYLYFLTDKEGKVYYAKTFEEHKLNKTKYLK